MDDMIKVMATGSGCFWSESPTVPGYFISEDGEVLSVLGPKPRLLRGSLAGDGYRKVGPVPGKGHYVHTLSCEIFNGPRPSSKHQVRHLDGVKNNNSAMNLAWGTACQNAKDKETHGTSNHGERNSQAKLTRADVEEMRRIRSETGISHKSLAALFGVSTMTAWRATKGISWK